MENNSSTGLLSRRAFFRQSRLAPYLQRERGISGDGDELQQLLFADDIKALNMSGRSATTTPTRGANTAAAASTISAVSNHNTPIQHLHGDADAAAGGSSSQRSGGGQLRNISSLNQLLPRVQSDSTIPRIAATNRVQQGQGRSPIRGIIHNSGGAAAARRNAATEASSLAQDGNAMAATAITGSAGSSGNLLPDWRLRDRMKTVGVGLVMALNVGTDPPDVVKPNPCAVLQCWMDPRTVSRAKAKEIIGERLEQQYAKWQLARTARPLKYRRALDPAVEDVRNLCLQLRRQARTE
jgi:Raptor N-terminal CASPase like domain